MEESKSHTGQMRTRLWGSLSRFWQFVTGVVFAIAAFTALFTDWKRPDLAVEITEVSNAISEKIDLELRADLSEVARLFQGQGLLRRSSGQAQGMSYADMDRSLRVIERGMEERERVLAEAERQYLDISQQKLSDDAKLERLAAVDIGEEGLPLALRRRLSGVSTDDGPTKALQLIGKNLTQEREKVVENRRKLDRARAQLKAFRDAAFTSEAKLFVTAAIGNRGSGATSLRPQALLRADLGEGNYLDITLRLAEYTQHSELAPQAFKVIRFYSDELKSMPTLDQERFRNLFNNISPTNLYITDVRGNVIKSNTIPFSQGVYEQKVFDSLKRYASSSGNGLLHR